MNKIDELLENTLRTLDPSLSTGQPSDLYSEVVRAASIKPETEYELFSQKISSALEEVYGNKWLINPDITKDVLTSVLYSNSIYQDSVEDLRVVGPVSAWRDGRICKFISCESRNIPTGKTAYLRDDATSVQSLKFLDDSIRPIDTFRVDFSTELSIYVDKIGRLLFPGHFFDNLFLEEQESSEIELPQDILKGRVYILNPSIEALKEYQHFDLGTLGSLKVDKKENLLQFGQQVGQTNIEVVSGFILSFNGNKLVNAWLKLENVVGNK